MEKQTKTKIKWGLLGTLAGAVLTLTGVLIAGCAGKSATQTSAYGLNEVNVIYRNGAMGAHDANEFNYTIQNWFPTQSSTPDLHWYNGLSHDGDYLDYPYYAVIEMDFGGAPSTGQSTIFDVSIDLATNKATLVVTAPRGIRAWKVTALLNNATTGQYYYWLNGSTDAGGTYEQTITWSQGNTWRYVIYANEVKPYTQTSFVYDQPLRPDPSVAYDRMSIRYALNPASLYGLPIAELPQVVYVPNYGASARGAEFDKSVQWYFRSNDRDWFEMRFHYVRLYGSVYGVIDLNGNEISWLNRDDNAYFLQSITYIGIENGASFKQVVWNCAYVAGSQQATDIGPTGKWVNAVYRELRYPSENSIPQGLSERFNGYDIVALLNAGDDFANILPEYDYGAVGEATGLADVFSLLGLAVAGLRDLWSIQVLPYITMGTLLFIPLVVGIVIYIVGLFKR